MRRTKIICTIGPSSQDENTLKELIEAGMDVARINFSHCPYDEALMRIERLHRLRKLYNRPLAVMLDTQGPEVRVGGFEKKLELQEGDILKLQTIKSLDNDRLPEGVIGTNLPFLGRITTVGQKILLADGYIEAKVVEVNGDDLLTIEVVTEGLLKPKAHLAIPGVDYPLPFLSEKDKADIRFAVEQNFDFIALSFVRSADDVRAVRKLIAEVKSDSPIRLIAKIEDRFALANLDAIIAEADGIMVARGDLGVELPIEELPVIQKKIIEKCYLSGKPVIVATQMLESMTEKTYPTRAEVTDVANAVMDLASAVMLSGETAQGKHPERVVRMMAKIIDAAEAAIDFSRYAKINRKNLEQTDVTNIISWSAIQAADLAGAKAIVVITSSGFSARSISKFRPPTPIHAFTFSQSVYHQLSLSWGVYPHILNCQSQNFSDIVATVMQCCQELGIAAEGDKIVIVAGLPLGAHGSTNFLRVETVKKLVSDVVEL